MTGGDATQTNAGDILWSGPVTHDTQNTGKAPVKTLVIELKEPLKAP